MRLVTLSLILLALGIPSGLGLGYNLTDLIRQTRKEIEADLQTRTINNEGHGGCGGQRLRNKVTKESEAMDFRNRMYRLVRSKLEAAGEGKEAARKIAFEAQLISDPTDRNYQAGGQAGFTDPVDIVDDVCKKMEMKCDSSYKYYRIDGKCNNLRNPMLGSMSSPFKREVPHVSYDMANIQTLLKPIPYNHGNRNDNGTERAWPCHQSSGKPSALPSPRLVSTRIHKDQNTSDPRITHMLTQWGQFLDHDITLTPEQNGEELCCNTPVPAHCLPILVPSDDPHFGQQGSHPASCLHFSKSVRFCEGSTTHDEQINVITHFIDGSNVYGSHKSASRNLRTYSDGLLKVSKSDFLPIVDEFEDTFVFAAGDVRHGEMPGLLAMHTLWVREHNRLAGEILKVDPSLDDETVFQEARRLVIAQMQNVVYNEYLPVILGESYANDPRNGLATPPSGTRYDPTEDPSIGSGFATAAFRFGHSMIQGFVKTYMASSGSYIDNYQLRNVFFAEGQDHYLKGMDNILLGLTVQSAQKLDPFVSEELTNHLLGESDLVAKNIQRGRDHGLGGYAKYRSKFHKDKTSMDCWAKKPTDISDSHWIDLMQVYKHPNDIDLFTGGLLENPAGGSSLVGSTFQDMIGKTFARLKSGDRFFFSHAGEAGSFTEVQRRTILNRRLSDVLCDNTKISRLQGKVFNQAHPLDNPVIQCHSNKKLDVSLFLHNRDACNGGGRTYIIEAADLSMDQAGTKSFFTVI